MLNQKDKWLLAGGVAGLLILVAGTLLFPDSYTHVGLYVGSLRISPQALVLAVSLPLIFVYCLKAARGLKPRLFDLIFLLTLAFFTIRGLMVVPNANSAVILMAYPVYAIAIYYGVALAAQRARAARFLVGGLVAVGLVVVAYALIEFLVGSDFIYGSIIIVERITFPGKFYHRSGSTIGHAVVLGLFLVQLAPFLAGYFITAGTRRRKLLWSVALVATALALEATYSKGAWVTALFLAGAGLAWVVWRRRDLLKHALISTGVILAALLAFTLMSADEASNGVISTHRQNESFQSRLYMWERTPQVIADNLVFGVGTHQGATEVFKVDPTGEIKTGSAPIDNLYLTTMVETGIVGTLIGIALLVLLFGHAFKALLRPKMRLLAVAASAVLVVTMVDGMTFESLLAWPNMVLFWLSAGIIRASFEQGEREKAQTSPAVMDAAARSGDISGKITDAPAGLKPVSDAPFGLKPADAPGAPGGDLGIATITRTGGRAASSLTEVEGVGEPENRSGRWLLAAAGAGFMALAFALYWPILNNTLIADDFFFAHLGSTISAAHLEKLFTVQPHFAVRPVVMFTFWVQSRLFGFDAWSYHVINVALHAGSAIVACWLLLRLGIRRVAAVAAALLFLLTPIAPEAVTWSAGRFDVLSLFLMLLTLAFYAAYLTRRRPAVFALAMAAAALALLAKELAYILLLLVPLMELLYNRKGDMQKHAATASGLAPGAGDSGVAQTDGGMPVAIQELPASESWAERKVGRIRALMVDRGFLLRMGIFLAVYVANIGVHYAILGKLGGYPGVALFGKPVAASVIATFKTVLSPLNQVEVSRSIRVALAAYTLLLSAAGLGLVVMRWRRATVAARRMFVLLAAFLVASVAPVYTPLFINGVNNTLKESRELYTPMFCLLALLAVALVEFGWRKRAWKILAAAALLVLVPVYAYGLHMNNEPWQRAAAADDSLTRQVVALAPEPAPDARMVFFGVPEWNDGAYMFVTGLPQAVRGAYGREDLSVKLQGVTDPPPDPGSADYIFGYDAGNGLLTLVKGPGDR